MNLTLTGHHLDITPSLRDYVTTKLNRLSRHFDQVIGINVVLSVEKLIQRAEATVHISGNDLFVQTQDSDMYAAIDSLASKLDRKIVRHKEKVNEHRVNSKNQPVE
ncbi:MAG TPA: ribosome-associated translation inhibitor RaiA [Burkholderiales bacterium]|nr:ribosome-associated translation inhibitor RaiA [Pseudomonadota bacterium]HVC50292.1 ribosome-associated translation inhibitor RaiA [Burkholderiales bacterium]